MSEVLAAPELHDCRDAFSAALEPSRPEGLTSRMTIKMEKATASRQDELP